MQETATNIWKRKSLGAAAKVAGLAYGLWKDEGGQNLVEYCVVAGLISLSAIYSFSNLDQRIRTAFNTIGSNLTNSV